MPPFDAQCRLCSLLAPHLVERLASAFSAAVQSPSPLLSVGTHSGPFSESKALPSLCQGACRCLQFLPQGRQGAADPAWCPLMGLRGVVAMTHFLGPSLPRGARWVSTASATSEACFEGGARGAAFPCGCPGSQPCLPWDLTKGTALPERTAGLSPPRSTICGGSQGFIPSCACSEALPGSPPVALSAPSSAPERWLPDCSFSPAPAEQRLRPPALSSTSVSAPGRAHPARGRLLNMCAKHK